MDERIKLFWLETCGTGTTTDDERLISGFNIEEE
tara:strand:- start:25968 stop:26069 length:102 start_codon:yes stop_codon:yes gene_type:complete